MRRTLFAVIVVLGLATAAAAQTDRFTVQLDQAKAARVRGKLDQSEQIVRSVLKQAPGHFRASYTLGLIQLDRGQTETGIKTLSDTVAALKGRPAPDPTIYNTLGWTLMGAGRFDEAQAAFDKGYACVKDPTCAKTLPAASQQKLLNNMALLARLRGQTPAARTYLQEAAKAGSPQARASLAQIAK